MDNEEKQEEQELQDTLVDLMSVLLVHGYTHVNLGALMRIVGVEDEYARDYDDSDVEIIDAVAQHQEMSENKENNSESDPKPTIH
jgi:hypothetical protein